MRNHRSENFNSERDIAPELDPDHGAEWQNLLTMVAVMKGRCPLERNWRSAATSLSASNETPQLARTVSADASVQW